MRATYWRDLVRRWVLVEEGIGSPDFLKVERGALLREAVAALTSDANNDDGAPCRLSDVACTCKVYNVGTPREFRTADAACPVHR